MKITKQYIEENLIKSNGALNNNKTKYIKETTEELYLIYNCIKKPICTCGQEIGFISFSKGYNKSCGSSKCKAHFSGKRKAIKKGYYKEELTKKIIQDEFMDSKGKLKANVVRKYLYSIEDLYLIYNSIEIPLCSCGRQKQFINFPNGYKNTCNGVKCYSNHPDRIKGIKENTNREKIGKKISKIKSIRTQEEIDKETIKSKQTKLKNHGNENFNNREKSKQTILERYKVKSFSQINIKNFGDFNEKFITNKFIKNNEFLFDDCMKYFNIKSKSTLYIKKNKLGITKQNKSNSVFIEEKINKELNYIFRLRTKQIIPPLEIDLYSKEHKIAIEYNGLMWHSYGISNYSMFNNVDKEDKNRHLNKTLLCEEKGIQLYHIFENEWLDETKKSIWISVLKDKQGLNTKIGARKCTIGYPSKEETRNFLNENHLQGFGLSPISIGLYYDTGDFYPELMSIMTFGKSRFNKNIEYELIRFCTKKGYSIQGGASRLLKAFEREYKPKSLISYANRRWSTGNLYSTIGFTFLRDVAPNYFYFLPKENILWSRNKFQKHKLGGLLEKFNKEDTESMNMFNNGYRRIWDSGNKVYIKEYKY